MHVRNISNATKGMSCMQPTAIFSRLLSIFPSPYTPNIFIGAHLDNSTTFYIILLAPDSPLIA